MDPLTHLATTAAARGASRAERAHLARALGSGRHALVLFYSKNCRLCRALQPVVDEAEACEADWMRVVRVCTDSDQEWAPEILHYGIEHVPCLVMLQPGGNAISKSGSPRNLQHMRETLELLLKQAKAQL
ncbi:unnamed protein product [Ostreobium quekettii]|uniref:Thioredoxin domain-containing protein n=1 Tax=Ostreobium quekettii TaxID=121088 RepID=A0A8S1IRB1_9CHLO|nr:unnamed protein product [Ostreobium quekettii]|eukprot:evm.model.scf_347.2 EVM.evm.TU.scf_347.2   scf_347:12188-14199(+)